MTEKTKFREHIAQSGGVCPQHSPGIPDERGELPSQRAEVFVERPLLGLSPKVGKVKAEDPNVPKPKSSRERRAMKKGK